jgi:hypothetical protein
MNDNDRLRACCHNILPGHGKPATIASQLRDLADSLTGDELGDVYGAGSYLENFEADIASEFGKPAAVFMPSGTMAQQIALRLWCQQSGSNGIAMHPTSHLETAPRRQPVQSGPLCCCGQAGHCQLPAWNQRARDIAAIINAVDGLNTRPAVPRVNFFQVYLEGEVTALQEAHSQVASDTGSFVFGGFRTTALPGVAMAEVHCWENAMAFETDGLQAFLETLIDRAKLEA